MCGSVCSVGLLCHVDFGDILTTSQKFRYSLFVIARELEILACLEACVLLDNYEGRQAGA